MASVDAAAVFVPGLSAIGDQYRQDRRNHPYGVFAPGRIFARLLVNRVGHVAAGGEVSEPFELWNAAAGAITRSLAFGYEVDGRQGIHVFHMP